MAQHAQIVSKAKELMRDAPEARWTISQLAIACNTSPTVLKESFRDEVGVPVGSWYRKLRMQCACQMMEANPSRSIASIAAELGYTNSSKFSRAFRDCMECSPSSWRTRLKKDAPR